MVQRANLHQAHLRCQRSFHAQTSKPLAHKAWVNGEILDDLSSWRLDQVDPTRV